MIIFDFLYLVICIILFWLVINIGWGCKLVMVFCSFLNLDLLLIVIIWG